MPRAFRGVLKAGFLLALTIGVAAPASASPIMVGSITITEHETGFADTTDTPTIAAGPEIAFNDGSNIGDGILLSGEYIDVGDSTLELKIFGNNGADPGNPGFSFTGYGPDAEYIFSDINFDTPGKIVGVTFHDNGTVKNFGTSNLSFSDNSITVQVGGLSVKDFPDFGFLDLDVATEASTAPPPVPEPGTMSLFGLGLAAAWRARRRLSAR